MRFLLAGAATLAVAAVPATADAAATCSYTWATGTVAVAIADEPAEVVVSRSAGGAIQVDGVNCGTATVTNTNTIRAEEPGEPGHDHRLVFDLANGRFGPGKANEGTVAGSEIEIDVRLGGGDDTLAFRGSPSTSAGDSIRMGTLGGKLNADADIDITYAGLDRVELRGNAGDDTLSVGGGSGTGEALFKNAQIFGGPGDDALTGGRLPDQLFGDREAWSEPATVAGDDTLTGGAELDHLYGDGGDDDLEGGDGDDRLALEAGDDRLSGGPGPDQFLETGPAPAADGADVVRGGAGGGDTLDLRRRSQNHIVTLDDRPDDGADTNADRIADEKDDYGADIENVRTGSGNDRIWAPEEAAADADPDAELDELSGGAGNDNLKSGAGRHALQGEAGLDTLEGGAGYDRLSGGPDKDRLSGGDGADFLRGGFGPDTANGGAGNDQFYEEPVADGGDVIVGGTGYDHLSSSDCRFPLTITLDNVANDGIEVNGVAGGEKDNVMAGVEALTGGHGADTLSADTDAANALRVANDLFGGYGDDTLEGGAGDDRLWGEYGNDTVTGGPHEDQLWGGWGNDKFAAADGFVDYVNGQEDRDSFLSVDPSDSRVNVP